MSRAPLHRFAAACAAVIAAATLTACSDPGSTRSPAADSATSVEDVQSPTASPSPSEPSAPEVEKPQRPAAMEKEDAEGAAAVAEYFIALDKYMMQTGDTTDWQSMSHRSCEYCASRLDQARTIAERGDHFEGGGSATRVDVVYNRDPVTGIWPMDVRIDEEATTITDASGAEVFSSEAGHAERRVEVGRVDGDWVVVEVAPIPEN